MNYDTSEIEDIMQGMGSEIDDLTEQLEWTKSVNSALLESQKRAILSLKKCNDLFQKITDIRVLRSSCADSFEGMFRVHLPEKEWDGIIDAIEKLRKEP